MTYLSEIPELIRQHFKASELTPLTGAPVGHYASLIEKEGIALPKGRSSITGDILGN